MTRAAVWIAALAGVLVGGLAAIVLITPDLPVDATRSPASTTTRPATSEALGSPSADHDIEPASPSAGPPDDGSPAPPTEPPEPPPTTPPVLLVWTAGGLPAELITAVGEDVGVRRHTVVHAAPAGLVGVTDAEGHNVLALEDGWQVPLDLLVVEPSTYAPFAMDPDRATIESLRPGAALLSTTSARLRGVGAGAVLQLEGGVEVTVTAVVDDVSVAGAEVVVHVEDAPAVGGRPGYLLLSHDGDRAGVQDRLSAVIGDQPVRFRSPAETTWLRHGDAVLPQALIKDRFGEFAVRSGSGRSVDQDPDWVERWITTAEVPILGPVRCHRDLIGPLSAALADLAAADLAHLVDPAAFAGCWAPRRIAPGQPLSRHAWGVAVDLNVGDNPRGSFSTQDARLVETMRAHGFTWGGTWLVPDPAHYEIGR